MPPSKRQIETLEAQGVHGENRATAGTKLGIKDGSVHKSNTLVYKGLGKTLDIIIRFFPIFKDRLVRDEEDVRAKLLRLNRKIREATKEGPK